MTEARLLRAKKAQASVEKVGGAQESELRGRVQQSRGRRSVRWTSVSSASDRKGLRSAPTQPLPLADPPDLVRRLQGPGSDELLSSKDQALNAEGGATNSEDEALDIARFSRLARLTLPQLKCSSVL